MSDPAAPPTTAASGDGAPVSEYDADTATTAVGPGRYSGEVTSRWSIGPYPNGGYLLGIALDAVRRELPHPDPFAVSAHFLSPSVHGPCEVLVDVLRSGASHATASARLVQDGVERMRVLATYGDLGRASGPTVVVARPPVLPPLDECVGDHDGPMPNGLVAHIRERFDQRYDPETVRWRHGERRGRGVVAGYLRFADGREADTAVLPLVCDGFPPAVFDLVEGGWVPTLELTVHVRARPAPGWLRCRFTTGAVLSGYIEEDGEVWDSEGRLVAQSRQLARVNSAGR